jgi:hypothetical protein
MGKIPKNSINTEDFREIVKRLIKHLIKCLINFEWHNKLKLIWLI